MGRRRPGHDACVQLQLLTDPDRHIHVVLLYVCTYISRTLAGVRIHHIRCITTTTVVAYSSSTCIWLPHRKSRLVELVEKLHMPVEEHVQQRYEQIFQAKERYQAVLKKKARLLVVFTPSCTKAKFASILMRDLCTNQVREYRRVYVVYTLQPPCRHTYIYTISPYIHCPGRRSQGEKSW